MKVEIFGSTDVGRVRDHNEDNFVLCKDLATQDWTYKRDEQFDLGQLGAVLFVADGMGGTNAGEVASEIAQESVKEEFLKLNALPGDDQAIMALVKKVIVKAHQNIVHRTLHDPTTAGMGTTAVLCWVVNDKAYVAWSGDSRMYLYREGAEFWPITDDHSIVWELVKAGQMSAEDARLHENSNIITQSLGDDARPPKPEAKMVQLHEGDRVMLCSDGLSGMVSDNMLGGILSGRLSTADTCKELINAANAGGGTDNITVLLLDVIDGQAPIAVTKSASSGVKTAVSGGAPINTVVSKNGPNKALILGVVAVLAIVAALVIFAIKPGQGVEVDALNDTVINPIDTPKPAPVIDTPNIETPVEVPANTSPSTTNSPAPSNTTVTPKPSPPGTAGENPATPGGTSPKPAPRDSTKPINIKPLPKDSTKPNTPGGLTPRNPVGPSLPPGAIPPTDGKDGDNN